MPLFLTPPIAKTVSYEHHYHGETLSDPYFWLREKENPEVALSLEAENAYADAWMQDTTAAQNALYTEILSHVKETDTNVPSRKGNYFYYSRTEEGKQYPTYCRKHNSLDADEEITLDLNAMAEGKAFLSLGAYTVSENGALLAYSVDETGFRQYTLRIKNLLTGEILPDHAERIGSVSWANDNETLFYTVEDEVTKRQHRLYRHVLGEDNDHTLLFEEKDERFGVGVGKTRSRKYLLLDVSSHTTSELKFLSADTPFEAWTLLAPRVADREISADHLISSKEQKGEKAGEFILRVNDTGRNFRIVAAVVSAPEDPANWRELVPHSDTTMIDDHDVFAKSLILTVREDGLTKLRVMNWDGNTLQTARDIAFPEPTYTASPDSNPEYTTEVFRYSYGSLITPRSIFEADLDTLTPTLLKQTEVPGGFDRANYASERIWVTAPDGVRVPVSLAYRNTTARDGSAPIFLRGYGSYGISYPASFAPSNVVLMDHGFVVANAHIRGGGDLGKKWHDAGRLEHKMNTFTDFIACAEGLIEGNYGAQEKLVISGGSAGGLLMGAVANLRPDLFRIVLTYVPFVDVVNTMMDATLPLTIGEYEEWGDPNNKSEYERLCAYCPYTNLKAKSYPAMLVRTSFNDSQVMYWEPAKYVARLRAFSSNLETNPAMPTNPLLFKTNMSAGHGGASGRYDAIKDTAWDFAFVMKVLEMTPETEATT